MRHHPAAQLDALADVQRQRAFAVKQVHPGGLGNIRYIRVELWRQRSAALQQGKRLLANRRGAQFLLRQAQPALHHVHIAHGAVACAGAQAMALHDGVQPVPAVLRVQRPGKAHGAQRFDPQRNVHAGQLIE